MKKKCPFPIIILADSPMESHILPKVTCHLWGLSKQVQIRRNFRQAPKTVDNPRKTVDNRGQMWKTRSIVLFWLFCSTFESPPYVGGANFLTQNANGRKRRLFFLPNLFPVSPQGRWRTGSLPHPICGGRGGAGMPPMPESARGAAVVHISTGTTTTTILN